MRNRASKYTRVGVGETTEAVESERSITVFGFLAANASSNSDVGGHETVTLFENDGVTPILTIQIPNGGSVSNDCEWLADKGINVTTGSNCTITIWHSQGGA